MANGNETRGVARVRSALGWAVMAIACLAGILLAARPTAPGGVADWGEPTAGSASERHRNMADCLWPTARNHGFYDLQQAALDAAAPRRFPSVIANAKTGALQDGAGDHALWRSFLASTGADDCGYAEADLVALIGALTATRDTATRHFAASDTATATWTSRAVDGGWRRGPVARRSASQAAPISSASPVGGMAWTRRASPGTPASRTWPAIASTVPREKTSRP